MKSYTIYRTDRWEYYFSDDAYQYLKEKGYNVSAREKMEFNFDCSDKYTALKRSIIFQNNNTGQFFGINHADQSYDVSEELISHDLCVGMLKCQYNKSSCEKWDKKVSAFTYGVKFKKEYFIAREKLKHVARTNNKMYFKGNENERRDVLRKLSEAGVINKDYGFRDEKGIRNQKISQETYLENMTKSRLSISLPGTGLHCHRELESFGMGVPVLMPFLKNSYYNNLIPDVHYIGVDNTSINKVRFNKYSVEEEDLLCEMIINRYNEVINNNELLENITRNAMTWFDENIAFPSNMRLMEHILLKEFGYEL